MRPTAGYKYIRAGYLALIVLLAVSARAQEAPERFHMIRTGPGLSMHKESFMLPVTISDEYKRATTEAVFQVSAKYRILNTPIYFAYTQISFWQAYDHHNSAPFRETNYNPEMLYRMKRFPFHGGEIGADLGFEHESNGQKPPISRSWNLLYACPYYYQPNFLVYVKLRYRLPEDEKVSPDDAVGDDNPDITDYLGYSDIHLSHKSKSNHTLHLTFRGNIRTGKGGIVMTYSLPVPRSAMSYFILRISHGYGESLVDYKRSLSRIGIGIMFAS